MLIKLLGYSVLFFSAINANAASTSFSPYADLTINTHWSAQYKEIVPMDLTSIATANHIFSYHLAFVTDAGTCLPAFGGQMSYSLDKAWGAHEADALWQHQVAVVLSFGGANGVDISRNCSEMQLVTVFEKAAKTYHAMALDFDIENGTANVTKLLKALKTYQQKHPTVIVSFTLPVLPEGLPDDGQSLITQAKKASLQFKVNLMAMDYGPTYNKDMGEYAKQAATSVLTFLKKVYPGESETALWGKIIITPMIGVNDVAGEQFTLVQARALKLFADSVHLGGLSMWSIARDTPCEDKWASPICSGDNLQTKDYDFVRAFTREATL